MVLVQDRERPVLPGITDRVHDGNERVGDDGVEVVVLHEADDDLAYSGPVEVTDMVEDHVSRLAEVRARALNGCDH